MAHILIVEDDEYLASVIKKALESSPTHSVSTSTTVDDAWLKLQSGGIQLVLLDIMLTEESGFDLLKLLRNYPNVSKEVPVIMLTNHGQIEKIERARELGANDFFIKSQLDLDALVKRIDLKMIEFSHR